MFRVSFLPCFNIARRCVVRAFVFQQVGQAGLGGKEAGKEGGGKILVMIHPVGRSDITPC